MPPFEHLPFGTQRTEFFAADEVPLTVRLSAVRRTVATAVIAGMSARFVGYTLRRLTRDLSMQSFGASPRLANRPV
jgi:hypothetical protein